MPVKPAAGVKVTTPVVVFTTYVPAVLVSVVTGLPPASSSRTEDGVNVVPVPGVSLLTGLIEIGVRYGVVPVSFVAVGFAGRLIASV